MSKPSTPPAHRRLALLAVLFIGCVAAAGCTTIRSLFPEDRKEAEQSARLLQLQSRNMRFADVYVGTLIEATHRIELSAGEPMQRYRMSGWLLAEANAAYIYATEDNAVAGTLDLITLASISRMVVEDSGADSFADQAQSLLVVQRNLEAMAWQLADGVLTPEQQDDLRRLLADWRASHPDVLNAPFIRFQEFAGVGTPGGGGKGKVVLPTSLMGIVGLDPLAGLDPAVRQVEQSRLLAERALYYAQRIPVIMDLQLDRSINRFAAGPESQKLQQQGASITDSAARFATVAEALPATLATEREALIQQLNETLTAQASTLRPLLVEMRGTLEAGSTAADAVDRATRSMDALVARFEKKPGEPPGRPFDVTEYTQAATQIAGAANQLEQLLGSVGTQSPKLAAALDAGTTQGRALVDYLFLRALWLIAILCVALLVTLLLYRRLAPRMRTT